MTSATPSTLADGTRTAWQRASDALGSVFLASGLLLGIALAGGLAHAFRSSSTALILGLDAALFITGCWLSLTLSLWKALPLPRAARPASPCIASMASARSVTWSCWSRLSSSARAARRDRWAWAAE